jgi:hypothetical protein
LTVEVSGNWVDPGAHNTFTWSRGVDSATHLERLIVLWAQIEQVLDADRRTEPPGCPPEALALLIDLAGEWMRLGAGFAAGCADVSDAQKQAGLRGGRRMLESMRPALQTVPGLALRAQRLLDDLARRERVSDDPPAAFDVDPDLQDLVRDHRHRADDIEGMQRDRAAAVEALACRLASLGPRLGAVRFKELLRQARLVGAHADAGSVAERMRQHMADPVAWYQVARETVNRWLLHAALAQCLVDAPIELPDSALTLALDDPSLRAAAVSAVLDRADVDHAAALVITDLRMQDAPCWTSSSPVTLRTRSCITCSFTRSRPSLPRPPSASPWGRNTVRPYPSGGATNGMKISAACGQRILTATACGGPANCYDTSRTTIRTCTNNGSHGDSTTWTVGALCPHPSPTTAKST